MSELLVVDEDPDPPSLGATEKTTYPINLETGLTYDGHELSAFYQELEEQQATGRLSVSADRILEAYAAERDFEDTRAYFAGAMLRRRRFEVPLDDRSVVRTVYFFMDERGEEFCRSWSNVSQRVGWCYEEERFEPADEVKDRLESLFPLDPELPATRQFGRRILDRLRSF